MGHCKHQWHEATSALRSVFCNSERRNHSFYVCTRCLKIDEVLAAPSPMPRPADEVAVWPDTVKRDAA